MVQQFIDNTFIEKWRIANDIMKSFGREELLYDFEESILYEVIEPLDGGEMRLKDYFNPTLPEVVLNRNYLLSLAQFFSIVDRKQSENNQLIISKHLVNGQNSISEKSTTEQDSNLMKTSISQSTTDDRLVKRNRPNLDQAGINQRLNTIQLNRKQKAIIKQTNQKYAAIMTIVNEFEKNTKPTNKNALQKLTECKLAAEIAKENNNIVELDRIVKVLLAFRNRREGIVKAQEQQRPELPLGEFIEKHKVVIELITSDKFIRKATKGHYKSFEAIREFVTIPNEITEAVEATLKARKIKEQYTGNQLCTIKNKFLEYQKVQKRQIFKKIKIGGLALAAILVLLFLVKILVPTPQNYKNTNIMNASTYDDWTSPKLSETMKDSLLKIRIATKDEKVSEWRINFIKKNLQDVKNEAVAIKIIDSLLQTPKTNKNDSLSK